MLTGRAPTGLAPAPNAQLDQVPIPSAKWARPLRPCAPQGMEPRQGAAVEVQNQLLRRALPVVRLVVPAVVATAPAATDACGLRSMAAYYA